MRKTAAPTSIGSMLCTCYGCGQLGQKIADYPMKNVMPPA